MARAALLERLIDAPRIVWRTATVLDVRAESPTARTLVLEVPGWPGHRAGQHVDVRLTADDGYQAERSYSISSAPESAHLELTVELFPDGEVSTYLTEELRAGDELELRGPIGGHFTWSVHDGGPLVLVAGGSGIAPLSAMLRHRAAQNSSVEAHLLASVRSPADALFADELAALEPRAGLRLAWTYTREGPAHWTGFTGRIDAAMLRAAGPASPEGAQVFVCGPTSFAEHVADLLVDLGYDPATLRVERFGPTGASR